MHLHHGCHECVHRSERQADLLPSRHAAKLMPRFTEYQNKTERQIPLLILTRIEEGK